MSLNSTRKGIYPGWKIVVTGFFLMAIIFAAVISLPGLFTIYVTEELNLTRAAFTVHMTISTLAAMVCSLFVGKIFQKYNIKLLMTVAALIVFVCFAGYSFATRLWHFYAISVAVGFFCVFLINVPVSILIHTWFGKKLKGKAMGIAMTGSGVGAMILNPVLSYINATRGWRMSYRLLALLVLAVAVPLILLTVEKSPQDKGWERIGDEEGAEETTNEVSGLTAAQSFKSSMFWILSAAFFLFAMTTTVFNVNGMPYFTDIGFDPVKAGSLMSVASAAVIFGKLLLGAACDKWNARLGSSGAIMCLIVGMAFLIGTSKIAALGIVAAVIFGFGNANATVTVPLIVGELFGNRDFGTLVGVSNVATNLGAGIGPLFGALIYDSSGSYIAAWAASIALMIVMLAALNIAYKVKRGVYAKIAAQKGA
jgi:MFS family permease